MNNVDTKGDRRRRMKTYQDLLNLQERLFKFILKCKKTNKPDLHSFVIEIHNGMAFVECRDYGEIYVETRTSQKDGSEKREQFAGTPIAATNFLLARNADVTTIEQ